MTQLDFVAYANTAEAKAALVGLAARASDPRPAMRVVRDLLIEGNKQVWRSQGSVIQKPWAANAPGTLEHPGHQSLMVQSGDLGTAAQGGKGRRTGATRSTARAGVAMHYARYLMGGRLPPRFAVGVPQETERKATEVLRKYLVP